MSSCMHACRQAQQTYFAQREKAKEVEKEQRARPVFPQKSHVCGSIWTQRLVRKWSFPAESIALNKIIKKRRKIYLTTAAVNLVMNETSRSSGCRLLHFIHLGLHSFPSAVSRRGKLLELKSSLPASHFPFSPPHSDSPTRIQVFSLSHSASLSLSTQWPPRTILTPNEIMWLS